MNLNKISSEEAIEMIKQGEHRKLWWKISGGTIGNYLNYKFPPVEKLLETTWYVMEDTEGLKSLQ